MAVHNKDYDKNRIHRGIIETIKNTRIIENYSNLIHIIKLDDYSNKIKDFYDRITKFQERSILKEITMTSKHK